MKGSENKRAKKDMIISRFDGVVGAPERTERKCEASLKHFVSNFGGGPEESYGLALCDFVYMCICGD